MINTSYKYTVMDTFILLIVAGTSK